MLVYFELGLNVIVPATGAADLSADLDLFATEPLDRACC
jgi:hypothetical protein